MNDPSHEELIVSLRADLASLLIADSSPARQVPQFEKSFSRCDDLKREVEHLNSIHQVMLSFVRELEAAEDKLETAKRELAAEVAGVEKFTGELGRSIRVGIESGNLRGSLRFNAVKRSLRKLHMLELEHQDRASQAGHGVAEVFKKVSQRVKYFLLIKLERRKLRHHQKVLGEVIITARDEDEFRCDETSETIDQITDQRRKVESSKEVQNRCEQMLNELLVKANAAFDRIEVTCSATLKIELEKHVWRRGVLEQDLRHRHDVLVSDVIRNPYSISDELIRGKIAAINKIDAEIQVQSISSSSLAPGAPSKTSWSAIVLIGMLVSFFLVCGGLGDSGTGNTRDILQEYLDACDNEFNADVYGIVTLSGSHADVTLEADYYDRLDAGARAVALSGVRDMWFYKSYGTRITFRDAYSGREVASFVK